MKFSLLIIFLITISCSVNTTKQKNKTPYYSKGFALIYDENSLKKNGLGKKLDNSKLQISHNKLKFNTLIKITNPKTKDSIKIKNQKKIEYPDFYKIMITQKVAEVLNIDKDLPLVEVLEIKKNKSFIAKKAKIYNEERKISSNAPVEKVKISNISKDTNTVKNEDREQFFILIGSFYSEETAVFLKKRIIKEIPIYKDNNLKIVKKTNKKINLISGPYFTINLMKNDYILLKKFGFEELDITTNE